jgi:hypothetical protein
MEKFFIVTDKSELFEDYFNYRNNIKDVNEAYGEFKNVHNITTKSYCPTSDKLYIEPTESDLKQFETQFSKNDKIHYLYSFKKNSHIGKEWINFVNSKKIKIYHKPFLGRYLDFWGPYRSRLFDVDKVVYCSIEYDGEMNIPIPKGFEEIKGSEFYKVIENEKIKEKL